MTQPSAPVTVTRNEEAGRYEIHVGDELGGFSEVELDDEGEFRMLAVDPAAQGAGAGTALARLCEDRAREHGATAMALSSLATMTTAHRIYGRLGYERDPGRDWSPVAGVHLLAFRKDL